VSAALDNPCLVSPCASEEDPRLSTILLTLLFLLLFLLAVVASVLAPFLGMGFMIWNRHKLSGEAHGIREGEPTRNLGSR